MRHNLTTNTQLSEYYLEAANNFWWGLMLCSVAYWKLTVLHFCTYIHHNENEMETISCILKL